MGTDEKVVNIFKAFADETRLKIINCIFDEAKSVKTISTMINATQSAVSHQIHILKINGILKKERKGKEVYYSLDDEHIKMIVKAMYEHAKHHG